jgi:hypothetical protein
LAAKFSLDGAMIPRTVKRMFDQRSEERIDAGSQTAVLSLRGRNHVVRLINLSRSGAMLSFHAVPHIGEEVSLQLLDHGEQPGFVRWVRDGQIGIHFARGLE